jgi:hypothetical protein
MISKKQDRRNNLYLFWCMKKKAKMIMGMASARG